MMGIGSWGKLAWGAAVVALVVTTAAGANATVRREGTWPDEGKPVAIDVDHVPRAVAVRKVAEAAGWSLVVQGELTDEDDTVDLHVKDQPAARLLDVLLEHGSY